MTTAEKRRAEGRAQGEALGRAQGEALGRAQGQAEVLLEQLTVKFGSQPVEVRARVFTATSTIAATPPLHRRRCVRLMPQLNLPFPLRSHECK